MPSSNPVLQPLTPVLESVVQLYSGAHKDIVFAKDIQPDMPDVFIDYEQIKRVFINLFENAIEAMGGSGRILVAAKMNSAGMAQIDIADEGPGIAADDVPEFSRKKTKSGLGLAIVLRIIKDHHGTISVTQNEPHGARFIIELPASIKQGEAPNSTFSVSSA
jgi:two-component system nitrogen regulation sensor histidine kinase NtrY